MVWVLTIKFYKTPAEANLQRAFVYPFLSNLFTLNCRFHRTCGEINPGQSYLVYSGNDRFLLDNGIVVIPLGMLLNYWRLWSRCIWTDNKLRERLNFRNMSQTRKQYDREFKSLAVELSKSRLDLNVLAKELEIRPAKHQKQPYRPLKWHRK